MLQEIYIVLLFIGVLMTFIQLVYLTAGKRGLTKSIKILEEKKEELASLVSDAELMVDELNRISDFIVEKVDAKNGDVEKALKSIDERMLYFKTIEEELKRIVSGIKRNRIKQEPRNISIFDSNAVPKSKDAAALKEKIIPLNAKHSQVMGMAKMGLNDTEIAKNLNIGKGEIELILGLNKADMH